MLENLQINSVAELRANESAWDDLWRRSELTDPTGKAELLAQTIEQFSAKAIFRALVVKDEGRFVAALPVVEKRIRWLIKVGHVAANTMAPGAGLMVDPSALTLAIPKLVASLRDLGWSTFWFERVPLDHDSYTQLVGELRRQAIPITVIPQYLVAKIPTRQPWPDYEQSLGSSTRKQVGKWKRRLSRLLGDQDPRFVEFTTDDIEYAMRMAFELENRTWKGERKCSIIQRGLQSYLLRQASTLATQGHFSLHCMMHGNRLIAFQYGQTAKRVFHDCKTSFDPELRSAAPGNLLYYHVLQQCFEDSNIVARDNLGSHPEAVAIWKPEHYRIGQIIFAPRGWSGRAVLAARNLLYRWRKRKRNSAGGPTNSANRKSSERCEA